MPFWGVEAASPLLVFTCTYIAAAALWSFVHSCLLWASSPGRASPPPSWLAPFCSDGASCRKSGNMLLSLIHSTLTSAVSLALVWRHGLITQESAPLFGEGGAAAVAAGESAPGAAPAAAAHQLLAFSAAYFLHDLISTLPDAGLDPLNILHHVAGVVLTATPLLMGGAPPLFGEDSAWAELHAQQVAMRHPARHDAHSKIQ